MKTNWMMYGAAALLILAGCQKPADNADQGTNQGGPGQGSSQQQANARGSTREAERPLVVPEGTSIPVVLTSALSSKVNKPGDEFEASVAEAVTMEGRVAIPKDSQVRGTIVDAKRQGTFKGEADLAAKLTSVRVRGKDYEISTDTYSGAQKGKGKRTAVVTGGGAAVGALIGGLAGGGKGAAIGAGVGAGGGLAASGATGGKNVEWPAESQLTFQLTQPLTIER